MAEEEKKTEAAAAGAAKTDAPAAADAGAKSEPASSPQADTGKKKSFIGKFLPWIIMTGVVVISAGAGMGLAKLFGGSKKEASATTAEEKSGEVSVEELLTSGGKSWYYEMEPVVANLNEPSVTRYIRLTVTLEISEKIEAEKGKAFIDQKRPELTNWLNIYLASQTLEDIRGDKNLRRIQSQILNSFNEKLFSSGQEGIKQVLFKEFAVQ